MAEAGFALYRMLDVEVELALDPPGLRERFDRIYGRFRAPADPAPNDHRRLRLALRSIDGTGGPALSIDAGAATTSELRAEDDDQLCLAVASLVYPASARLVLHAGALARDGDGIVVCASSGTGKTTFVLELARRGLALLSDELAPIDPATGTIEPFPRAVGLREGALAVHSWINLATGSRARNAKGEFKLFVDPARLAGVRLGAATAIRHVLFLSPPPDLSADPTRDGRFLELTFAALAAEAEAALATIDGVESVRRLNDRGPGVTVRLEVGGGAASAPSLERWSRAFRAPIAASRWGAHVAPRFDRQPSIERLTASDGLVELAHHLLNGRPPSRLLDAHGGSTSRLLLTLARATADARFWRLVVGDLGAMASLVEAL